MSPVTTTEPPSGGQWSSRTDFQGVRLQSRLPSSALIIAVKPGVWAWAQTAGLQWPCRAVDHVGFLFPGHAAVRAVTPSEWMHQSGRHEEQTKSDAYVNFICANVATSQRFYANVATIQIFV